MPFEAITLFAPCIIAYICAMIIIINPRSGGIHFILSALLMCFCFATLSWGIFCMWHGNFLLDITSMTAAMLIGPLYMIYGVRRLRVSRLPRFAIIAGPTLFVLVSNLILYIAIWPDRNLYLEASRLNFSIDNPIPYIWKVKSFFGDTLFRTLFALQTSACMIWTAVKTKSQYEDMKKVAGEYEAKIIQKDMRSTNLMSLLLIITTFLFASIPYSYYASARWAQIILSMSFCISTCLVTITAIANSKPRFCTINDNSYDNGAKPDDNAEMNEILRYRFDKIMSEGAYLNADLNSDILCDTLKTNRTELSMMINRYYGKSLREYLMEIRIQHAIRLIDARESSSHVAMKTIAIESGYNNSSTFYRNFKDVTGMTVRDWMVENGIN